MDARARARRGVLIAGALALAACARGIAAPREPAPRTAPVAPAAPGGAPSAHAAQAGPALAPPPASPTPLDATFRERLAKVGEPVRSLGHAGGLWKMQRWADEAGRRALEGGAPAPGATLVAELLDAGGGPGPVLGMQRLPEGADPRGGGWTWTVLSTRGEPLRSGALADCAGCHSLAKRDGIYGAR